MINSLPHLTPRPLLTEREPLPLRVAWRVRAPRRSAPTGHARSAFSLYQLASGLHAAHLNH